MYCKHCGQELSTDARFCPACGQAPTAAPVAVGAGQVGFSPRINDPAFAKYIKNSNSWSALFSLILAVVAIAGFFIYGETGSEMENPQALYIGFGIGGMFVFIALLQILGRKRSKTWDGIVVDKQVKSKRRRQSTGNEDNDYYWVDYTEFAVVIRQSNGKLHQLTAADDDTVFNYYQINDRVRHHGGLNSYEKYDKSRDTYIFCNACASLNSITDVRCARCKCPILK